MHKYAYKGTVMIFDKCVTNKWAGETVAESEKKAKSNLAYQFKKEHNLNPTARITLPDKVQMVG